MSSSVCIICTAKNANHTKKRALCGISLATCLVCRWHGTISVYFFSTFVQSIMNPVS